MLKELSNVEEIVICLYDGKYHYGVAALANSLVASGFKGIIHIGYRDLLPPWLGQLKPVDKNTYQLEKDISIYFEHIQTDMHLAYYKPYFIKHTVDKFPIAKKFFYFDVDIIVTAPWIFFSNWLNGEVCLCLDNSFDFVHNNHPWRKDWKLLAKMADDFSNPITHYVNSGFIGIAKENITLIDKWINFTKLYQATGNNLKQINQEGHNSFKGDQDLLNAAITVSPDIKLSLIGKEGMGFTQPAYLMTHAVVKNKPWSINFLRILFKYGRKPTFAERNFFNHCKNPINLFSKATFSIKKANLFFATKLGRYLGN